MFLVVGAGFAGSVIARELADAGYRVLVLERRPHVGGNAYDEVDRYGILIHPYGPHIFHTNSERVWRWLSRFTKWTPYHHRTLVHIRDKKVPFPINCNTLAMLYGIEPDPEAAREFIEARRQPRFRRTSEDVVLDSVGEELCELFFRHYTWKMWGMDLKDLDASVVSRVPIRFTRDDNYFLDKFQAMPKFGYTPMFKAILDHSNIAVELDVARPEYEKWLGRVAHTFFTGPRDEFFALCLGRLPYRSMDFVHQHLLAETPQPAPIINYPCPPADAQYTRITDFKQMTGQSHPHSSVCIEYPSATGEPYYPIPRPENAALYRKYASIVRPDVTFVGRLAEYRYYNMDQVVGSALKAVKPFI